MIYKQVEEINKILEEQNEIKEYKIKNCCENINMQKEVTISDYLSNN